MDINIHTESALNAYDEKYHDLNIFLDGIQKWFASHPNLSLQRLPVVHSVKARMKNRDHLRSKLKRKYRDSDPITCDNIFNRITH